MTLRSSSCTWAMVASERTNVTSGLGLCDPVPSDHRGLPVLDDMLPKPQPPQWMQSLADSLVPRRSFVTAPYDAVQWKLVGHTDAEDWPTGELYLGIDTLRAISTDERGGWFVIDFDDDTKETKSLTAFATANCKTGGFVANYMYEHGQRQGRGKSSEFREPPPLPDNATFSTAKERICGN